MANIRKQAILSSIIVYFGFMVGAINTYFFTKEGSFTPEQFGLTRIFYDVGQNIFVFGSLGVIPVMFKFFPYYKSKLPDKKNDLLTWALVIAFLGFIMVLIAGYILEPMVIRKFSERSQLIPQFYHLLFPFGFGMLFFSILEAFCWSLHLTVFSNFLKETGMRIIVLGLILLYLFNIISFEGFIYIFTFLYIILFFILLFFLVKLNKFHLTFKVSNVTLKFKKKMLGMQSLVYGGIGINVVAQTIDTILISSLKGLGSTGIFSLAQYISNLIVVPQRSVQSISTGILSEAWRVKNMAEINRIYQRSCINLLLMALFIFGNIWINIFDAFTVLKIQSEYATGVYVLFVLAIARLIDAGTGVNGVIIGTSTFWRFDLYSGMVLLAFRIPLTYFLIKNYGILGSAIAEVFAYTVYNFIRFEFLRRKFNMQPFSKKTVYALILAAIAFAAPYFTLHSVAGWTGIFSRSVVFSIIFVAGIFTMELTPDAMQMYYKYADKLKKK